MRLNDSARKAIKVVQPRKKSQRFRFIVIGCSVAALFLIVLLFFPQPKVEDAGIINEDVVALKSPKKHSSPASPVQSVQQTENTERSSDVVLEAKADTPDLPETNRVAKHSGRFIDISKARIMPRRDKPRRFDHQAEEAIASLLEITPGATIVGSIDYHKHGRFEQSFKESLASPTQTLQTDDAYTRELKSAVNEVKADLKQRMDAGEDIADLMTKSRDELQQLGLFRMQLQRELNEIRKDDKTTAEEYEDFVKAANVMLEQKGAKPLTIPRVVYNQLLLRQERTMNQ